MNTNRNYFALIGLLAVLLLSIVYFLLSILRFQPTNIYKSIPHSSSTILHIYQWPHFLKTLNADSSYFKLNNKTHNLLSTLSTIDSLLDIKGELILTLSNDSLEQLSWLAIQPLTSKQESRNMERWLKNSYPEYAKKNNQYILGTYQIAFESGAVFASNSLTLLKEAKEQSHSGNTFRIPQITDRLMNARSLHSLGRVYRASISKAESPEKNSKREMSQFAAWSELEIRLPNDGAVSLNGFIYPEPNHFASLFTGIQPAKSKVFNSIPLQANKIINYNFHNSQHFAKNLVTYIKHQNHTQETSEITKFFSFVQNEIAYVKTSTHSGKIFSKFVIVETSGRNAATNHIPHRESAKIIQAELEPNRTLEIFTNSKPDEIKRGLSWLFPEMNYNYYMFLNNYLIFGETPEDLKSYAYSNLLNETIDSNLQFLNLRKNIATDENFFAYGQGKAIKQWLHQKMNISLNFDERNELAIQISSSHNLLYTSIYAEIAKAINQSTNETVWQSRLDYPSIGKPVIVDNHINGEKEIVVQDDNNNLYLINKQGIILWKRQLNGRIASDIYQIDYYGNNKLQLLFNTEETIYLLDRNGNHVARYPIMLPHKATNGLSVFDYDNNNEYRIFLALNNNEVYLYDKRGNRVMGWESPKTEGTVTQPVQYFRNNNRDYILFSDEFNNYITDRRGNQRIVSNPSFIRHANAMFFLHNEGREEAAFITLTTQNELAHIQIRTGETKLKSIEAKSPIRYLNQLKDSRNNSEYILSNHNSIHIISSDGKIGATIGIDEPFIPEIDIYRFGADKIKIGAVLPSTKQLLLFSREGIMDKAFPLTGNTRFSITRFDRNETHFNLITGGNNNFIYNYRIE